MKISNTAVRRPVAMSMVIVFILIIGFVALSNLTVDLFPELDFPIVAILASYPGIGPEEIENLLVAPLENIVGTVTNVEAIQSSSRLGGALIIVQFNWGTDMNFATLQVRERIEMIRELLPQDVPLPTVVKFDPRTIPIIQFAVSSSSYDLAEIRRIVENRIKPILEPVEGVASVEVEGGRERVIRVTFDPEQLRSLGLTLQSIQQLMLAENMNLPGGQVTDQQLEIPVRIIGQFQSLQDIENLSIPTNTGTVLPLSAIAKIEETFKPTSTLSFMNDAQSIGISIQKSTDTNTVTVANQINRAIEKLSQDLPELTIETIFDQSLYIKQSIRAVTLNMVIGSILAGLILLLFLRHVKSTLVVAFSIPISIIGTFILLYFSNQTLNLLTLGGLALGVGLMVDNSIVIIENIYRYRQLGFSKKEAAIKGTSEVGPAIIAATLTSVIVFLPIIFVDGLAAQIFKPLALSVSFSLLASLFTSIIIVPLFSSRLIQIPNQTSRFQSSFHKIQEAYKRLLIWVLQRPRKIALLVFLLLVVSCAGIPFIGTEFLPHQDQSMISLSVRLPAGNALERTLEVSEQVTERIKEISEIKNIYVTVGGAGQFQVSAGSLSNRASYNIQLVPLDQRKRSDLQIADEIRQNLKDIPDAQIIVQTADSGFSSTPISLEIRGQDLNVLKSLGEDIVSVISSIDGVREAQSDFSSGLPELQVRIDRRAASSYGLTTAQVAGFLREHLEGITATRLSRAGDEIDVMLGYTQSTLDPLQFLTQLQIQSPLGLTVPLEQLIEIKEDQSPATIRKNNRIREVVVSAQLIERDLGSAISEIRAALEEKLTLPSGYSIHFGGQNEQMLDAFRKLSGALILAVVLVYMVMAAQFESYFYPFIIMLSVPLTVTGVIIGLLVTFKPLGVGALVGLLILTGIVVNNAIVFIDYVNTLRKQGMNRDEALATAGPVRLRPIMMTTLTTIIGLFPLMLGFGEGAELQAPMATVIVFGLSFATIITLVFVPAVYKILDEWREKKHASASFQEQ